MRLEYTTKSNPSTLVDSRFCPQCGLEFRTCHSRPAIFCSRHCADIGKRRRDREERFWAKVDQSNLDGCWIWTAAKSPNGYGHFYYQGKVIPAHRFSYELHYGPLPPEILACHECDNPPCVKPTHLFAGTDADNMHDMMRKGRHRIVPLIGEANGRAKFNEEQVLAIRERWAQGGITIVALADSFSANKATVATILHNRSWRHLL